MKYLNVNRNSRNLLTTWVAVGVLASSATTFAASPKKHQNYSGTGAVLGQGLYEIDFELESQGGEKISLAHYRGKPVVISMFYGSCPHACPMLISAIKRLDKKLPAAVRKDVHILMVSFDPKRDTPERLRALMKQHNLDSAHWTLARGDANDVKTLAAALGIKYRMLPSGQINHSSVITALDSKGVMLSQMDGVNAVSDRLIDALGNL